MEVKVWANHYRGFRGDPATFLALMRIFGDIFESVTGLPGTEMEAQIRNATKKIRQLNSVAHGEIRYAPIIAQAVK